MQWQAPQTPIMIDVICYDTQHKDLLTNKPYPANAIIELIKSPTEIHRADLLTYMMVHRKGSGPAEYSSIQNLLILGGSKPASLGNHMVLVA